MPIRHPGNATLQFKATTTQNIKGVIRADVNITRIVSNIKLPIKCYKVDGEDVGSWFVFHLQNNFIISIYLYILVYILIFVV